MENQILSVAEIHKLAKETLMSFGADEFNAGAVADIVTMAERDGCVSHGLFPTALQVGRPALIEAAKTCGIAVMPLIGIHHFAALWTELEPVCEAGLAAFACTSYKPSVIPAGGKKALFGTNPIAFGWPRNGRAPMIFDMATSVMARGEVGVAARDGHTLPEGVGVDADGNATTDPHKILKGALMTFGGYKGSSLSMMVEL